jgi:hypothetical protein
VKEERISGRKYCTFRVHGIWYGHQPMYRLSEKSGTNGNFNYWLDDMFAHSWIGRRGPVEWATRSPDLNPLDFAFWGFLKAQVYAVRIQVLRRLRQRITDCCTTVDSNMLSKIRTNMVKRLRKCVECRGEHIEHIM